MHKKNLTPEEELYQLLIVLVEKFKQEFYHCGQESTFHFILLLLKKKVLNNQI